MARGGRLVTPPGKIFLQSLSPCPSGARNVYRTDLTPTVTKSNFWPLGNLEDFEPINSDRRGGFSGSFSQTLFVAMVWESKGQK